MRDKAEEKTTAEFNSSGIKAPYCRTETVEAGGGGKSTEDPGCLTEMNLPNS